MEVKLAIAIFGLENCKIANRIIISVIMDRKHFLGNLGLAVAGTCIIPLGCKTKKPNELITIGMIGTGSHGVGWNLKGYLRYPELCRVVAVCDVSLLRAKNTKKIVDEAYRSNDCKVFQDFRELLEDDTVDAVQISTPDHWHVPISIMAALKGKHVCCEKPTLTIDEGRLLCDVMEKTGVIYQVSVEDRFVPQYHKMAEIALNGRLGKLQNIEIQLPVNKLPTEQLEITTPPEDLDYDLWLGPTQEIPYIFQRTFYNFRWYDAFSGGLLTDWGAHYCDTAQLVTGNDILGPTKVKPLGETKFYDDGIFNTARQFDLEYQYNNDVNMRVKSGIASIRLEGDEGWVECKKWRGILTASNDKILDLGNKKIDVPTDKDEHHNFLTSIINDNKNIYPAELGHRLSTLLHVGNIALKLNREVEWNPQIESFNNDPEAETLRKRKMRDKWSYAKICPEFNY